MIGLRQIGLVGATVCLVSFVACGPEIIYQEHKELPGYWMYADSLSFAYTIADTSQSYDLVLTVEHTDEFPTQNMYTRFVTSYPNGLRQSEPVSLELSGRFGEWLGSCSGAACRLSIPLQAAAKFPEPGDYGLTLHQSGRKDTLQAVSGVELVV